MRQDFKEAHAKFWHPTSQMHAEDQRLGVVFTWQLKYPRKLFFICMNIFGKESSKEAVREFKLKEKLWEGGERKHPIL